MIDVRDLIEQFRRSCDRCDCGRFASRVRSPNKRDGEKCDQGAEDSALCRARRAHPILTVKFLLTSSIDRPGRASEKPTQITKDVPTEQNQHRRKRSTAAPHECSVLNGSRLVFTRPRSDKTIESDRAMFPGRTFDWRQTASRRFMTISIKMSTNVPRDLNLPKMRMRWNTKRY